MARRSDVITDPVLLYPGLGDRGWLGTYPLPPADPAFLQSFYRMPEDTWAKGAHRSRLFAQFLACFDVAGELMLKRLPHRPFIQPLIYNPLSGGELRKFGPIDPHVYRLLRGYRDLTGISTPTREQGFNFDEHALERCAATPLLWKLQAKVATPAQHARLERILVRILGKIPEIRPFL